MIDSVSIRYYPPADDCTCDPRRNLPVIGKMYSFETPLTLFAFNEEKNIFDIYLPGRNLVH